MTKNLHLIVFLCAIFTLPAQHIQRKYFNGFPIQTVNDSIAKVYGLTKAQGVLVVGPLIPGGTAEDLGVKMGDIVLKVNNISVSKVPSDLFAGELGKLVEGSAITYTIWRDKKEISLSGKAKSRPKESFKNGETIYDEVAFRTGYMPSILSKPLKSGKMPAILLVQGFTCDAVCDVADYHPYRKFAEGLVEKGYVVMRVEKAGSGNSVGLPDCSTMDVFTETEGFEAALKKLKTYPFVDSQNVFVFGHSMGGKIGPLMASRNTMKGLIVYGTIHHFWSEYLLDMVRYQNPKFGDDFVKNEADVRMCQQLLYEIHILKKKPSELAKTHPEWIPMLKEAFYWQGGDDFVTRDVIFSQTVDEMNTVADLQKMNCHFFSLFGEADIEALRPESQKLMAEIVNHYHPGKGTFQILPETDHSFIKVGSQIESFRLRASPDYNALVRTNFNTQLIVELDNWMQSVMKN